MTSPNIFLISDHHFGHANILTFRGLDGNLIRPGFHNVHHMDEHMIERHNKVVGVRDVVYFGGDVGFSQDVLDKILPRMNGKKKLILGNHDNLDNEAYRKHFEWIRLWEVFTRIDKKYRFILSHVPLHTGDWNIAGKDMINIHGHIHEKKVMLDGKPDKRYYNICVEALDYTPVSIEEIR